MLDRFRSLNLFAKLGLILVALILIAILSLIGYTKYIDHQLKETANSINVPKSWELKETELSGNVSCLDSCRNIQLTFENMETRDEVVESVNLLGIPEDYTFDCQKLYEDEICGDIFHGESHDYLISVNRVGSVNVIKLTLYANP